MRLFVFWVDHFDYDEWDKFAIVAKNVTDARKILDDNLGEYQKASDFRYREVHLNVESAGIICESFNAG